ncbi:MAG: MBL fold metallo-hydrolase [Pseudolabrys sp.]
MRPINLGKFSIGRVTEIEFPAFDAAEFFPTATPEMIDEARRALPGRIGADGKLVMSFHSFVVKTGRFTILIDTCCAKSRPGREQFDHGKNDYLQGLADMGVRPEEVTHVMCTHLHWDHVGWNTRLIDGQWVPTFPNAKYIMASANTTSGMPLTRAMSARPRISIRWRSRTACCRSYAPKGGAGRGRLRARYRHIARAVPWPHAGPRGGEPGLKRPEGRVHRRRPSTIPFSCCSRKCRRAPTSTWMPPASPAAR